MQDLIEHHKVALGIFIGSVVLVIYLVRTPHSTAMRVFAILFCTFMMFAIIGFGMKTQPKFALRDQTSETLKPLLVPYKTTRGEVRDYFGSPNRTWTNAPGPGMQKNLKKDPNSEDFFGEHYQYENWVVWPFEKIELDIVFDNGGLMKSYSFGKVH